MTLITFGSLLKILFSNLNLKLFNLKKDLLNLMESYQIYSTLKPIILWHIFIKRKIKKKCLKLFKIFNENQFYHFSNYINKIK